jgi:hypothetical protein
LSAGAIEREHQLRAGPLPEWMLLDEFSSSSWSTSLRANDSKLTSASAGPRQSKSASQ